MLKKESKLGSGTYGIVYLVSTPEGEKYALKRNLSELDNHTEVLREIDVLNRLRGHPRIITIKMITNNNDLENNELNSPLKDKEMNDDIFHFIFELADSDLDKWLRKNKLTLRQYKQFMIDILLGVEFINLSGIIHRDLKPGNMVVFRPGDEISSPESMRDKIDSPKLPDRFRDLHRIKICDFGLSTPVVHDDECSPGVYTPWYRAPEIIGGSTSYDERADCWATGCVLYELLFRTPFTGKCDINDVNIARAIIRKAHYKFNDYEIKNVLGYTGAQKLPEKPVTIFQQMMCKSEIKSMIIADSEDNDMRETMRSISEILNGLLQINPSKRWSATTALDHSFFDSHRDYINDCRRNCEPRYAYQHNYDILDVPERKWISKYIIEIYDNRKSFVWYTHKRLLHAIDLFDRVLRYLKKMDTKKRIKTKTGGHIISNIDAEIYFFCCLRISITLFGALVRAVDISEIVPKHLQSSRYISKLKSTEIKVIVDIFKWKFYRYTIYEAIHDNCEDKEDIESHIYHAITKLTINTSEVNGIDPVELSKDINEIVQLEKE